MKYQTKIMGAMAVGLFAAAASASAGKMYQFSGQVTAITGDTLSLKKDGDVLEFTRDPKGAEELQKAKVGDQVTIWYTLDAQKMRAQKSKGQQPGQAAPSDKKDQSREKKGIIVDDRAFYDANNDIPTDSKTPHHG